MSFGIHECKYCSTKFVSEVRFKKHECEQMKKAAALETRKGQAAFFAYKEWLRMRGYREPSKETFLNSRYFTSFMEFNAWAGKVQIPDRIGYMKYATKLGLLPGSWKSADVYESYMAEFDKLYSPLRQVEITCDTLSELSRVIECKPNEIFNYLYAGEVMKLIQSRKMSPWLLLYSQSFLSFLRHRVSKEERILINGVINIDQWREKFKKDPESAKKIRQLATDLSL